MNRKVVSLPMLLCAMAVAFLTVESVGAQQTKTDVKIDMKSVGHVYKLQVKTKHKTETLKYLGKIVSLDDKKVVMTDVTKIATNEQGVPMLKDVPYVSRLFKNVGVAHVKVEGKVTLKRSDIIGVEIVKQKR